MGPYNCYAENCGKRTDSEGRLCDEHECECGELAVGWDEGLPYCAACYCSRPSIVAEHAADPPDSDDEPEEPTDPESTPIMVDPEDPGEHLEPHKPELGGES